MNKSRIKYKRPGRPPDHDPVMNVETRDIFDTYTEAALAIGGDRSSVRRVAYGVQAHHKGYHFVFISNNYEH